MACDANKDIARAFVAAFNARDWAQLDALVAADFRRRTTRPAPLPCEAGRSGGSPARRS
jgi:ketosteroid isomerase-like protein